MCDKIDWEDLRKGCNRIRKTNYFTITDMLKYLYAEQKTLEKTGSILGVSSQTVCDKMRDLDIPRLPSGHRGKSKCTRVLLALGDVSKMTTMEIAKAVGFSRVYVTVCLQREGIKYQKGRKRKEK